MHKPLPSTETLKSRNAKKLSKISQVYLRAGWNQLTAVINWLILDESTADNTFTALKSRVWFENSAECAGKLLDSLQDTNNKAWTVLCSIVKLLESGRALKKSTQEVLEENTPLRLVFPLHFFHAITLPACFATEQRTA